MNFAYFRNDWKEIDDLAEQTAGRSLPVGGFIFGDSFDTFLRKIDEDYLLALWKRLSAILAENNVVVDDLSWGWMHPGVTRFDVSGPLNNAFTPGDYIGWTSCELSEMWRTERQNHLDKILRAGQPPLRCSVTWRSLKWRIAPDDVERALKLIEALCTTDTVYWSPEAVFSDVIFPWGLWRQAVAAIRDNNQQSLNATVKEAKRVYTPVGFRILILGCTGYLQGGGPQSGVVKDTIDLPAVMQ